MRRSALATILVFLLTFSLSASSHRRSHGKSPHAEIAAVARIETTPVKTTHKNGREFEEFDVAILSVEHAPEGDAGGDSSLAVDTSRPVHVVHDLTCGGIWLGAKPGDLVEIKGEYVHPPRGQDLIHFTHPTNAGTRGNGEDGGCGRSAGHPGGYLRPARSAAERAEAPAGPAAGDLFTVSVRPVLARRCAPCHEKGGKMYARLPFDDPSVVSSHAAGVRKRLKGDDLAALEEWLAALTTSSAAAPGS